MHFSNYLNSTRHVQGYVLAIALPVFLVMAGEKPTNRADLFSTPPRSFVAPSDSLIRYTGRFDLGSDCVRFDWAGAAIEAAFCGTTCAVRLNGRGDSYNIFLNGQFLKAIKTDSAESVYELARDLGDTAHTVMITKRFESPALIPEFKGFLIDSGKTLQPLPPPPPYRIEFIGASNVLGFGNEASGIKCIEIADSSNCFLSFGPLTARALNAECFVVAASSKGVVRRWASPFMSDSDAFESYYSRTLKNDPNKRWNHSQWVPHVVVLSLGTNDFSTRPHPTKELFRYRYLALIEEIRCRYPLADVVCLTSSLEPLRSYVHEIVTTEKVRGCEYLHFVSFDPPPFHERGCDWHPQVIAHEKIADKLVKVIGPLLIAMHRS